MILITGATGFVGRVLLRLLVSEGRQVSCLLRPSRRPRRFPQGAMQIASGTLQDAPALRAALQGVDTVIHLAGARRSEGEYTTEWINHRGTANLVGEAANAGVKRVIYLSHLRADRNSAFPLLRSKGAAEAVIRDSGLTYSILRSSLIFGPEDNFTTVLAMLIKTLPIFPVPGAGKTRFQPIHVDDVAACLVHCLDARHLGNATVPIGGPQHLSYSEILNAVMKELRVRRARVHLRLPLVRTLVALTQSIFPNPPISSEQLDLFSIDNTTALGSVAHSFGFEPRRFDGNLGYLNRPGWRRACARYVFQRK